MHWIPDLEINLKSKLTQQLERKLKLIVCISGNASLHNQTNYSIIHYRCSSLGTYNGHYNETSIHTGHVLKITDEPHEDSYSLSNGETALSDDANASIEFKQIQTSNSTVEEKPEKPIDKKSIDDEIEFHDGWLPDHYEWVVWLNINLFFRFFFRYETIEIDKWWIKTGK